ncbi:MAG TPA: hypothetical protein V6D19_15310 [Stenomitos sp.]
MNLQELQEQVLKLSVGERLQLIHCLQRSLQNEQLLVAKSQGLANSLIGIAKIDDCLPTDAKVKAILDERLVQKYL